MAINCPHCNYEVKEVMVQANNVIDEKGQPHDPQVLVYACSVCRKVFNVVPWRNTPKD